MKKYLPQAVDGLFLRGSNTWTAAEEHVLKITSSTTSSNLQGWHVSISILLHVLG